jgi:hypothetical protein
MSRRILGLAIMMMLAWPAEVVRAQPSVFEDFITRRGDQLYDGDRPLRFIAWNVPNLLVVEDAFEFLGEAPWRWPDEFEIADALETVRQMGGGVARSYVISVRREGSDMGEHVHVLGPGEFNERAFAALDLVLKVANEKGVRVIIPLVDNWKWMGGAEQYAAFRGKAAAEFWTDPQLIADFKRTIDFVVNRRNALTGVRYRDDPAILGWETGNELDAPPEWTAAIAAYLKRLDANHLVIDGRSLHGVSPKSLDDPNIDVVTTHHYPSPDVDVVERIREAASAARGRKPYFVGEIGFIPLEEARRALEAVIESQAAGALYWSLRFHRREGGFYWHSEPNGENLFKAYHWPGFDSGAEYRERELLKLLVESAARIRGEEPALSNPPAPARLLSIETPARISWQGSTGSSGYDVERAERVAGPWTTLATEVSDAATQYAPLFADESATPGREYFYRVVARNTAGAAAPSNVFGPVRIEHATIVDELNDESLLSREIFGPAKFKTSDARRVQEDSHRLDLAPGGAVVYELPAGIGIAAARLWIYASEMPALVVEASASGVDFAPLELDVASASRNHGDYGYLSSFLVTAAGVQRDARFLRIRNRDDSYRATPGDIPGQPASVSLELARVEIDGFAP